MWWWAGYISLSACVSQIHGGGGGLGDQPCMAQVLLTWIKGTAAHFPAVSSFN